METMRAGRMIGIGEMVCEETEVTPPGEGDVVVRSTYASICGSDLHIVCHGVDVPRLPCPHGFPGHEGIGTVVESRHDDFAAGDLVLTVPNAYSATCFNEIQTLPGAYCVKLTAQGLDPLELLMAQQMGTVIWAMRRNQVDVTGATVVVIGQGSAGLFFTHLLRRAGAARIITTDLVERRMKLSDDMGADVVVANHGTELRDAVMDLTAGQGADHVVEAVGRATTFTQAVDLVRQDGTMLWFGLPDTEGLIDMNFHDFFRKRLTAWSTYGAQDEPNHSSFRAAADMIVRREIDVSGIVSHVLPIEDIGAAFDLANDPAADDAVKVSLAF